MAIFYLPPAGIDDFSQSEKKEKELRADWDAFIQGNIASRDEGLFYDAANDPAPNVDTKTVPIPWNGFPRALSVWFNADTDPVGRQKALATAEVMRPITALILSNGGQEFVRFTSWREGLPKLRAVRNGKLAEEVTPLHRQQDEYCEWHIDREGDHIRRISFTAEGPEYWQRMAKLDPELVVKLYKKHVGDAVVDAELFWDHDVAAMHRDTQEYRLIIKKGAYNPYNRWNTTHGIMHLTHPSNTLGAEINLAADATVVYPSVPVQPAVSLPARLMCCAQYGGVNRSSDPLIGAGVNGEARNGVMVTLANPVGLYIGTIDLDGLRDPNGKSIGSQSLTKPRVSADGTMILRAEIKPPDGSSFTLDRCKLNGELLKGGGLIAQKITMRLFGLVKKAPAPARTGSTSDCRGKCCSKADVRLTVTSATDCAKLKAENFAVEGPWEELIIPAPVVSLVASPSAFVVDGLVENEVDGLVENEIPQLEPDQAKIIEDLPLPRIVNARNPRLPGGGL